MTWRAKPSLRHRASMLRQRPNWQRTEHSQTRSEAFCATFDGLTLGSGPATFTVTASCFVGVASSTTHQVDASGNTIPQRCPFRPPSTAAGRTFQPAFTGQSPQVLEEGKLLRGENRLQRFSMSRGEATVCRSATHNLQNASLPVAWAGVAVRGKLACDGILGSGGTGSHRPAAPTRACYRY